MPKALVLSNGRMLVNLNYNILMSDFYYPHVGMEDHTTYRRTHKIGVYTDNSFSWLGTKDWNNETRYHRDSLVGDSWAKNANLKIDLHFEDLVSTSDDIFIRRITVHNNAEHKREIKLFFNNDFHMYGEKMQDTAEYEPYINALLHYRKKRYFLCFGVWDESGDGLTEFATGKSEYQGKEGTWKDAEDGSLQGNPIEQGSVDSTLAFKETIEPGEHKTLNYVIAAGYNYNEVKKLHDKVLKESAKQIYRHTLDYWKHWSNKMSYDFEGLPSHFDVLFKRSLLIIKSQIDHEGAVIAANDSDIIKFNKDTYTYMWGRDAAIAIMAMNHAHYSDTSKQFFLFISKLLTEDGYFLHKYNPDGSLGSSWHPKFKHGEVQLPIQEDETALPIFAFYDFLKSFDALEFVYELYDPFVKRSGYFMSDYIYTHLHLPLPSYDPWEEQRGVFSYTTACTYGGLIAAASLAESTANYEDATKFTLAAEKIKKAMLEHLYCDEHKRFMKKLVVKEDQIVERDFTVDASLCYVWRMGVLPPDDERVVNTMHAIRDRLWVKAPIGGIARYENDYYQREFWSEKHPEVVGNPWIITTLWYAQWLIEIAKSRLDFVEIEKLLNWVCQRTNHAGILAEQVDPFDGRHLSVAPLTWSHSEYVITILAYRKKMRELGLG